MESTAPLESLEDVAFRELGETPAIKEAALNELRQLLSGAWNADICKVNDFCRVGIALFEHFILQEDTQVRGVVATIDLQGLSIYHLVHYTPSVIRTVISLAQIQLFGHNLKELHQLMPNDVIPEEHGGTNESYDFDPLEKELESEEVFFRKLGSYGYYSEPSLRCPTGDAFLVKFLRARKYDEQAAFINIKKYFKARKDHPEMFQDLTPTRFLRYCVSQASPDHNLTPQRSHGKDCCAAEGR
ncbi:hypothetical protein HPB50_005577 [Hyalomma asiaticum]|uniref:Uncharacterized protein n=1 Tax=Hyalomma asiaticum TaxID=266040 RepID=A0ACB7SJV8_HYAAI|nr:hypothetical protein HPB50_005577 [Hyalomma asiaticum]